VTVRGATYAEGHGNVDVECSPEEDIRRIVDALSREYDADVLAKREREHDVTTAGEFRDELSEELTDRQENALRTAFFADYFESPRGSSAQEVAEALDITGPTLLHHLRAGQRKLLAEFFDVSDPS
jgi:predicted DNA binding protein